MSRFGSAIRPIYILPVVSLIFYAAFLTQTYYWDGVLFSLDIEQVARGDAPFVGLFHPNHLLYSPLGYLLYSAALACGIHTRAITVLQLFSICISAAASAVLYVLAKRSTGSANVAAFCGILFASGATWWKFSTDADAYILCVLLLLLGAFFSFSDRLRVIPAGLCHISAMLLHELSIFFYVPLLLAIALEPRWSKKRRIGIAFAYLTISVSAISITYLMCYAHADHQAYPTLWKWIASFDRTSTFTRTLGEITGSYFSSYLKLFVGGRLSLIAEYFSLPMILAFCACLAALVSAVYLWRHSAATAPNAINGRSMVLLWSWFLTYALFLASWDAGNTFHKLFVWPAIVLLIGMYVARHPLSRVRVPAFLALAIGIAAWNFGAFIYPHAQPGADPVLRIALTVNAELPKSATVYYKAFDPDDWYLAYFAPGRRWLPLPASIADIAQNATLAAPVCFETTALGALRLAIPSGQKWDLVNQHHNIRLECLTGGR
ncbi:MAG: hypothetical protein JO211_02220 [Acidobacteriaceae bacterium]|nr:hypothetical protein [Acidobacteriaceae bacterium]